MSLLVDSATHVSNRDNNSTLQSNDQLAKSPHAITGGCRSPGLVPRSSSAGFDLRTGTVSPTTAVSKVNRFASPPKHVHHNRTRPVAHTNGLETSNFNATARNLDHTISPPVNHSAQLNPLTVPGSTRRGLQAAILLDNGFHTTTKFAVAKPSHGQAPAIQSSAAVPKPQLVPSITPEMSLVSAQSQQTIKTPPAPAPTTTTFPSSSKPPVTEEALSSPKVQQDSGVSGAYLNVLHCTPNTPATTIPVLSGNTNTPTKSNLKELLQPAHSSATTFVASVKASPGCKKDNSAVKTCLHTRKYVNTHFRLLPYNPLHHLKILRGNLRIYEKKQPSHLDWKQNECLTDSEILKSQHFEDYLTPFNGASDCYIRFLRTQFIRGSQLQSMNDTELKKYRLTRKDAEKAISWSYHLRNSAKYTIEYQGLQNYLKRKKKWEKYFLDNLPAELKRHGGDMKIDEYRTSDWANFRLWNNTEDALLALEKLRPGLKNISVTDVALMINSILRALARHNKIKNRATEVLRQQFLDECETDRRKIYGGSNSNVLPKIKALVVKIFFQEELTPAKENPLLFRKQFKCKDVPHTVEFVGFLREHSRLIKDLSVAARRAKGTILGSELLQHDRHHVRELRALNNKLNGDMDLIRHSQNWNTLKQEASKCQVAQEKVFKSKEATILEIMEEYMPEYGEHTSSEEEEEELYCAGVLSMPSSRKRKARMKRVRENEKQAENQAPVSDSSSPSKKRSSLEENEETEVESLREIKRIRFEILPLEVDEEEEEYVKDILMQDDLFGDGNSSRKRQRDEAYEDDEYDEGEEARCAKRQQAIDQARPVSSRSHSPVRKGSKFALWQ